MAHVLTAELRYAVMQAAFEGKVVQQNALDTPIFKTLSVIKNVKNELIQNKIIKQFKTSPIKKEETLNVPDNWFISRLNDVIDVRDGTHDSPKYQSTGIPFITSKNLVNGTIDFTNVKYISKEDADNFNKRSKVSNGDILMAMIGSIGKPVLVQNIDTEFAIKNVALFKKYEGTDINMAYVYLYLKYAEMKMNNESTGGVQKFVSLSYLRNYIIPLPPIEEQARIVAKVDEIMAKIDEYEKLENQLVKLKEQFPQDMKDSLLQAGMMGELTGCQPNSTESYSNVFEISGGSQPSKSYFIETPQKEYVRLYQTRDYGDKPIPVYIPKKFATKQTKEGDILLARYGGSLGKVFIAHDGAYNVAMVKVIPINPGAFLNKFIYYYHLSSAYQDFCRKASNGRSAQAGFNKDDIASISVNVFPIEEQQRIVDKLDELLPLVDKLAELN